MARRVRFAVFYGNGLYGRLEVMSKEDVALADLVKTVKVFLVLGFADLAGRGA